MWAGIRRKRGGLLRQARVSDQPPCEPESREPFPRNAQARAARPFQFRTLRSEVRESELGFESPRGRRITETRGEQGRGRPSPREGRPGNGRRSVAMPFVLVVDQERRPLAPVHPGAARWLLSHGKAAVLHRTPFTLILKRACVEARPEPLRLKLDPESHTTGLAVANDGTGQ